MLSSSHFALPFLLLALPHVHCENDICGLGQLKMDGACFAFGPGKKSWDDAEEVCERNNMHLARINTQEKNDALNEYISRTFKANEVFWTDLKKKHNYFVHTSINTRLAKDPSFWNPGEPSKGSGEDCVAKITYGLDDIHCNWQAITLCEAKVCPSACPEVDPVPVKSVEVTECKDGAKKLEDTCYFFETSQIATWDDANRTCAQKAGKLARMNAEEKYKIVDEYLLSQPFVNWRSYWVAGRRVTGGDEWNEDASKSRWHFGEPNNHNDVEDCVQFHYWPNVAKFEWNDANCGGQFHYICELKDCPADCRSDDSDEESTDTDTNTDTDSQTGAGTGTGASKDTGPNIGAGTGTGSGTGIGTDTETDSDTGSSFSNTTDLPLINSASETTEEATATDATTSASTDGSSDNDDTTETESPADSAGQATQARVSVTVSLLVLTVAGLSVW